MVRPRVVLRDGWLVARRPGPITAVSPPPAMDRAAPSVTGIHWVPTALMGAGLVAMLTPLGDPVPGAVWLVAFGLLLAWSLWALARGPSTAGRAAWARQAVACVAMVSMVAAMTVAPASTAMSGMGAAGAGPSWPADQLAAGGLWWLALASCGCLGVWAALSMAGVRGRWPVGLAPRRAALCDAAMVAAMAYMLLAR
jgi:hypothetical protein